MYCNIRIAALLHEFRGPQDNNMREPGRPPEGIAEVVYSLCGIGRRRLHVLTPSS